MKNVVVVLILLAIAAGIIWYLIRAKKRGQSCIGCPYSKQCSGKCNGGCSCDSTDTDNKQFHD